MGTGFKRDIGGGPTGCVTGLCQGHRLCVRPAAGLCPATANNAPVLHDDAPHWRIGPCPPLAAFGKSKGGTHVALVIGFGHRVLCWGLG